MLSNVTVLFSLSMSVKKWQAMGLFEKEILIFSEYIERGLTSRVSLFTYDDDDAELIASAKQEGLINPNIEVVVAPRFAKNKIGAIVYSLLGPVLQRDHFRCTNAVYSHQSSGAWTGLLCKLFYGNHFVYRYGHSLWRRHLDRRQYHRLLLSWPLDRLLNWAADYTLICTKRDYLYAGAKENSAVCPNFIDTKDLRLAVPEQWQNRSERAVFVGRLMPFKNLFNLIEACAKSDLPLDIYGSGPLEKELREFAAKLGSDCQFKGVVNNQTVRTRLLDYKIFFLVSTYEGMPKSLLEGMASGCACIVSPHYGCTEIIEHEVNGWVCQDYSAETIGEAIALARGGRGFAVAFKGQQDIEDKYSLVSVIDRHRLAYLPAQRSVKGTVS